MKDLAQFKAELGVTEIRLMQGKGRMFAKIKDTDIIVGKDTDMSKPLYVVHNDEKGFYIIVNSNVKQVATI